MSHSGSFLVGSQLDPTLALLMPSSGRLVPGAIPLPSRARFVSAASVDEASPGDFRDLVQLRSDPPPRDSPQNDPGNAPGNAPRSIDAEAPSFKGLVPGALPGVLPGTLPDTAIVALPQAPSIESQTSESRGAQAQEASDSAPVPLQPEPAPPPGTFLGTRPGTLPEKNPAVSSNLAADFRQALAHYRAAALQLG